MIVETACLALLVAGGVVYAVASILLQVGALRRGERATERETPFVSVVVPARNEARNIRALVDGLAAQDYPADRWELWLIDDRSDDGTGEIAERELGRLPCATHLVRQREVPAGWSPKKYAITSTIRRSGGEVILTTDADCRPEPHWISAMMRSLAGRDLVAGYSPFNRRTNLFRRMLALEAFSQAFQALAGIRLGWPITCTGRSFAYRREVFERAGGFGEARSMLSGDDHLFLQRAVRQGFRAGYCTEPGSFVWTDPPETWRGFVNQRIRMFSGVGKITPSVALAGGAAYLWMLTLLVGMAVLWPPAWIGFGAKFVIDGVSLLVTARELGEWRLLRVYPATAFCYLPYFLTFAFLGTFGTYDWKGMRGR